MKNLKIKITGGGNKQMLVFTLTELASVIQATPIKKLENGVKWEDGIITTSINESEDLVECDGCGAMIDESHLYCPNCGNENF
jgi:hypothetical protein